MTAAPGDRPDDPALRRPVGWWLKEADARLDAAFDDALADDDLDRRGWQVLDTVSRSAATPRRDVVAVLTPFDPPAVVEGVVDGLCRRGWVDDADGVLTLTPDGAAAHERVGRAVAQVREQVTAALPPQDYVQLVGLLARLVAAFPSTES